MRALVLGLAMLTACGARTGLDVPDAQATLDASVDHAIVDAHPDVTFVVDASADVTVDATQLCPAGYFIEVTGDAGTTMIQGGCHGSPVPSRDCVGGGEDCLSTAIDGCDTSSMTLSFGMCSCGAIDVGVIQGTSLFKTATTTLVGPSTIDVTSVTAVSAVGNYDTTVFLFDGGAAQHLHGAFCVRP